MTRIYMEKRAGGCRLRAEGHAAYDSSGRDIVCAAISALIFSLTAELERMKQQGLIKRGARFTLEPGRAEIDFKARIRGRKRAAGALGVLCRGLEMLTEEYPENVEFVQHLHDKRGI